MKSNNSVMVLINSNIRIGKQELSWEANFCRSCSYAMLSVLLLIEVITCTHCIFDLASVSQPGPKSIKCSKLLSVGVQECIFSPRWKFFEVILLLSEKRQLQNVLKYSQKGQITCFWLLQLKFCATRLNRSGHEVFVLVYESPWPYSFSGKVDPYFSNVIKAWCKGYA